MAFLEMMHRGAAMGWPETLAAIGLSMMIAGFVIIAIGSCLVFGGFFARFGF